MTDITEMIYSDDFADYLIPGYVLEQEEFRNLPARDYRSLQLNSQYGVLFARRTAPSELFQTSYNAFPKLYMPLGTESLEFAGITKVREQPALDLTGRGVLLGFLDSGIDFTHPAFRDSRGDSRILGLWDQTLGAGPFPADFPYGREFTREQLNQALNSQEPFQFVPSRDETGHGTALAGIAAGRWDPGADFTGAAPEAGILAVKLKPAKSYLKNYFFSAEEAVVYQENDFMAGLSYLIRKAQELQMPLVICLAAGTNQGGHSGDLPFCQVLNRLGGIPGIVPVAACGSEAGRSHHFYPNRSGDTEYDRSEILVPENSRGFVCEIWGQAPQKLSVGFRSPAGETIPRIPATLQENQKIEFSLENTEIEIAYQLILPSSGSQVIRLRFQDPSPGIWEIRVYRSAPSLSGYHIWLPMKGMLSPDIVFLTPDPYTTLTAPSDTEAVLSIGTCNAADGSLDPDSGRGFTRLDAVKPDLTAPGIALTAPGPAGNYLMFSGSSAAAALTAGASALLMEWGMKRGGSRYLTSYETKILLIRGALRQRDLLYPSREWGYGTLDLYQAILSTALS